VSLITITGPGRDLLPPGTDGRVTLSARTNWNNSAPRRWRELHRAAAQTARRKHGRFSLVAWTWEYQRRGILHKHLVVGVETARERAAAHTYVAELDRLRQRHGFGFVDRGRKHRSSGTRRLEVLSSLVASRYVAKYLSPLDDAGKPSLSDTVTQPDVPALVHYVSRNLTGKTGITMRYLRHVRLCWVLKIDPVTGETRRSIEERMELTGKPDDLVAYLDRLQPT
jgi:hypothetical protein